MASTVSHVETHRQRNVEGMVTASCVDRPYQPMAACGPAWSATFCTHGVNGEMRLEREASPVSLPASEAIAQLVSDIFICWVERPRHSKR